jgi:4-carboxymuconolactone decarboxylase
VLESDIDAIDREPPCFCPPLPSSPRASRRSATPSRPSAGATRGPFLIWLRSPELAEKVDALGAYCRFDSHLNERLRELSLLIAARHFDAQYSWNAHHQKAIEAGLAEWGEAGLVDIIGCLGNFSMLAMLLNTFQVDLKPGDEPPFPDVRGFRKV